MIIYNILRHEAPNGNITGIHSSYYTLKNAENIIKQIASKVNAIYHEDKWEIREDNCHVLFSIEESCLHEPKDVPFIAI